MKLVYTTDIMVNPIRVYVNCALVANTFCQDSNELKVNIKKDKLNLDPFCLLDIWKVSC